MQTDSPHNVKYKGEFGVVTAEISDKTMTAVACCTLWSSDWHPVVKNDLGNEIRDKRFLVLPESLLNGQQFRKGGLSNNNIENYHREHMSYLTPDFAAALQYTGCDNSKSAIYATIVQFKINGKPNTGPKPIVLNVGRRSVIVHVLKDLQRQYDTNTFDASLFSDKTKIKEMQQKIWVAYGVRLESTGKKEGRYDFKQHKTSTKKYFKSSSSFASNQLKCLEAVKNGECIRVSITTVDYDVHTYLLSYADKMYGTSKSGDKRTVLIGSGTLNSFLDKDYMYHHSEIIAPANAGVTPIKAVPVSALIPRSIGPNEFLENITHNETRETLIAARPPEGPGFDTGKRKRNAPVRPVLA